jgi:undecaprenyl diphosphate synthase
MTATPSPTSTPNVAKARLSAIPQAKLPKHIAVIMDGNGRWAQQRGLPRIEGHRRGVQSVRRTAEACAAIGIEALTLYCLSSENWKRPAAELSFLMQLLEQFLVEERRTLRENDIRLMAIGRRDRLPSSAVAALEEAFAFTSQHSGMKLVLALDYGGRDEIARAARSIAERVQQGTLSINDIDESCVANHLDTANVCDPDLMIRTGGDWRVSNFLLWQLSYAELWVTESNWPDFTTERLCEAIEHFVQRDRRFGGLHDECLNTDCSAPPS